MITFAQEMRTDLKAVLDGIERMEPFALVRYGDGEASMLRLPPPEREYQKRVEGEYESWDVKALVPRFRAALLAALETDLEGYCIGVNCRRCDWLGREFCVERMKIPLCRQTFAELFGWINYDAAFAGFSSIYRNGSALVTCGPEADHEVPPNIAVNPGWHEDQIVSSLLEERRPILVAAGPGANTIVHRYWDRQAPERRVPIVDIGALLDTVIHDGEISRAYQREDHWGRTGGPMGPGEHQVCRWPGKD
jgi:hypothetical protein